jgi:hypothetical protein
MAPSARWSVLALAPAAAGAPAVLLACAFVGAGEHFAGAQAAQAGVGVEGADEAVDQGVARLAMVINLPGTS